MIYQFAMDTAGNYTLTVFYADREQTGAVFELSSTLDLVPPPVTGVPEPATVSLMLVGLASVAWKIKAHRAR